MWINSAQSLLPRPAILRQFASFSCNCFAQNALVTLTWGLQQRKTKNDDTQNEQQIHPWGKSREHHHT